MRILYNEIDTYCCDWMSNLMDAGVITPGDIDERSIVDLDPTIISGYDRFHTFAGIGVWEYAIIQSGLAERSGIWTGSCPCQPFSASGQRGGFDDERHLWPAWFHLIEICRPSLILGEQVASKDGLAWLDLVSADLEGASYAIGAGDLCAAGFGAPHIRQRQYLCAIGLGHDDDEGLEGQPWDGFGPPRWAFPNRPVASASSNGGMADDESNGREGELLRAGSGLQKNRATKDRFIGGLDDAAGARHQRSVEDAKAEAWDKARLRLPSEGYGQNRVGTPSPTNGFWRDADWLGCRDGKWRPVEPGTFPLAHGASSRVGRLRAYGNAIVAQQAIEWCNAAREFIEVVESGI